MNPDMIYPPLPKQTQGYHGDYWTEDDLRGYAEDFYAANESALHAAVAELGELRKDAELVAGQLRHVLKSNAKNFDDLAELRQRVLAMHTGENMDGCGMTNAEIEQLRTLLAADGGADVDNEGERK